MAGSRGSGRRFSETRCFTYFSPIHDVWNNKNVDSHLISISTSAKWSTMSAHKVQQREGVHDARVIPGTTPAWLFFLVEIISYPVLYVLLIVYLPYIWIKHHTRPQPFPTWTWTRCRTTRVNKLHTHLLSFLLPPEESPDEAWSIPPLDIWRAARERGVRLDVVPVQPVPDKMRVGVALCDQIEAVTRPGFWIAPPTCTVKGDAKWEQGEKVILHLHGGGYIRGHALWTGFGLGVAERLGLRCFGKSPGSYHDSEAIICDSLARTENTAMNYRKCLSSSTAFPAPLLDSLAAYIHLTRSLGIPAENIILLGESAGGHLLLCLSRYLLLLSLPQPGHLILISPWSDFSVDPTIRKGSYEKWTDFDTCHPGRLSQGIRSAMRYYPSEVVAEPYFSPARSSGDEWTYLVDSGVRVYLAYGTRELFEDEILDLLKGMKAAGVNLELQIVRKSHVLSEQSVRR